MLSASRLRVSLQSDSAQDVLSDNPILQKLGAHNVLGSQGQYGLPAIEAGVPATDDEEWPIQMGGIGSVNGAVTSRGQKESDGH
jgi:hypothetical protein